MNEKEMNLAILNKLYEIAAEVWAKMAKVADYGSYTAKEINKMLGKNFCFSMGQNEDEQITVAVDTYQCAFPLSHLFHFVTVFEKLAKAGMNAKQFVFEEAGELLGEVTFEANKRMQELCDFVSNDEMRPVMNYIYLDAANKCLVATNGNKLLSLPINILECSGDNTPGIFISPNKFAAMCKKMRKGVTYKMTATNELRGGEHYGKIDFDGIISNVEHAGKFPNHRRVFPAVSNDLALHIGNAWGEAKKFVKKADSNIAYISGTAGNNYITLECGNNKRNIEIENTLACDFLVAALNKTLESCEQIDTLYLGEAANCPIVATNSLGNAYLIMPAYIEEGEYKTFVKCEGATFDVNVLEERDNNHTQSVETAKIDAPAVEAKKELEPEQKTATKAAPKVATLDADAKKFTFAKVGVNVGDVLTFVDGTEVVAADNNQVDFRSELFTLSGFCKAFMPNEKRTKSNSYRGCDYFYKDGVKLGKLLKEYQKNAAATLEDEEEKVASEPHTATETPEHTITPEQKDIAIERKESVSKATMLILGANILAKAVTISFGLPPECAATSVASIIKPPGAVRLVSAGNKSFYAAVDYYLLDGGKVVHTLPLPPPGRKKLVN